MWEGGLIVEHHLISFKMCLLPVKMHQKKISSRKIHQPKITIRKFLSKWLKKKKPENEIESKRVQDERELNNSDLWEGELTMEYHFSLFSN